MSTMQNEIIGFEPVSADVLKKGENFDSAIYKMVDGKKVPAEEETSIIFQKYTGYAPAEFPKPGKKGSGQREMVPNPPEKRDYIKIKLDPNDSNCNELRNKLNNYDEEYENNYDKIFDDEGRKFLNKTNKKGEKINEYKLKPSIKENENDKEEEEEGVKPKSEDYYYDTCKLKLAMSWAYYYNDEKLDANNTKIIKKAISDKRKATKGTIFNREILNDIAVNLEFKDDDGDVKKVSVKMGDIQSKKTNIDTAVFLRRPTEMVDGIKKPNECSEEELDKFYGEPKYLEECTSPEQFEKYYKNYSYVRFVFKPERVRFWDMAGRKECAIHYVIYQIEIIREPYVSTTVKQNYKEYCFGGSHKKNLLIDQSVDNQYKENDDETNEAEAKVESTKVSATNKTSKLDVEDSESEESGSEDSGSEESGSESEESESESESEKEPVVSKKISKTTQQEKTKKQVASKKK
jgi:hypothetical protein